MKPWQCIIVHIWIPWIRLVLATAVCIQCVLIGLSPCYKHLHHWVTCDKHIIMQLQRCLCKPYPLVWELLSSWQLTIKRSLHCCATRLSKNDWKLVNNILYYCLIDVVRKHLCKQFISYVWGNCILVLVPNINTPVAQMWIGLLSIHAKYSFFWKIPHGPFSHSQSHMEVLNFTNNIVPNLYSPSRWGYIVVLLLFQVKLVQVSWKSRVMTIFIHSGRYIHFLENGIFYTLICMCPSKCILAPITTVHMLQQYKYEAKNLDVLVLPFYHVKPICATGVSMLCTTEQNLFMQT
jgi:hypothetical protein